VGLSECWLGQAALAALVLLGHAQPARAHDEVAKLIGRHLPNVLTYFTHRITNAVAEGLNSKIATVQKRACGFRNPEHFKIAVYFHCGGLNLYPGPVTHTKPG